MELEKREAGNLKKEEEEDHRCRDLKALHVHLGRPNTILGAIGGRTRASWIRREEERAVVGGLHHPHLQRALACEFWSLGEPLELEEKPF